ncbi:MAG: hypothetical protein IJV35_11210 [Neisseriaceae bacterium]|nr:hypothetical protein [Neisseriaceae bacterium]MBQ9683820.1 hypothetical protein [Neisseriaceae bacterium]MBQ9725412.1 hypothetical protein [Neisseriaceae bacterium]MBR1818880.1 hypothetical protein [Neisseriaceae bacterium]
MNITHEQLATLQKIATHLGLLAELTHDSDNSLQILLHQQMTDDYAELTQIVGELAVVFQAA